MIFYGSLTPEMSFSNFSPLCAHMDETQVLEGWKLPLEMLAIRMIPIGPQILCCVKPKSHGEGMLLQLASPSEFLAENQYLLPGHLVFQLNKPPDDLEHYQVTWSRSIIHLSVVNPKNHKNMKWFFFYGTKLDAG